MVAKKGTPSADRVGLQKWFGNLQVIEAKTELRVQPNKADIECAVKADPRNCVFSKACQRMWGSTAVVFFGTVAYVDLLDSNGVRHVERFMIGREGKKFIRDFDAGKKLLPKGFRLPPPTRTQTAAGQAAKARRREALIKGRAISTNDAPRPKRKPTSIRLSVFRNGKGMVHFPQAQAR